MQQYLLWAHFPGHFDVFLFSPLESQNPFSEDYKEKFSLRHKDSNLQRTDWLSRILPILFLNHSADATAVENADPAGRRRSRQQLPSLANARSTFMYWIELPSALRVVADHLPSCGGCPKLFFLLLVMTMTERVCCIVSSLLLVLGFYSFLDGTGV